MIRVLPAGIRLIPSGNHTLGGSGHLVRFNVPQFGNPYTTFAVWFSPLEYSGRMLFGMNQYDIWFSCGGVGINTGCADVYGFALSGLSAGPHLLVASLPSTYPNSTYPPVIWFNGVRQTLTQLCGSPCSRSVGNPVRIGGWTTSDLYQLDGVVVHFFVWNRLLTDAEVQQLYNCGWRDPCPPLDDLQVWIGPDGRDRVADAPVLISNARAMWYNSNTGDGYIYAEVYSGATTSAEPPNSPYAFIGSGIIPIEHAWFGAGGCGGSLPASYRSINIYRDERYDQAPYWVLRMGGPATYFALVYKTNVYLPQSGTYTIEWIPDDGFRLYIDGTLVIDNWTGQAPSLKSAQVTLSAGWHSFVVKYFEGAGCWSLIMGLVMPDGTPVRPLLPVYGIRIRPG